jgi:hypothetical protein
MVTLFGQGFDSPRLHKDSILPKDLGARSAKITDRASAFNLKMHKIFLGEIVQYPPFNS